MSTNPLVEQAIEVGQGVLRLMPTWVPRVFCVPGRRLRLHPADLYALGASRGGIDERWFSSTTRADNGPGTPGDEGLSYIYVDEKLKVTLLEAMDDYAAEMLGQDVIDVYGGWVMYSKFFDNMYPLPFHMHQDDEKAADVGQKGKPEAYFFPAQYNHTNGTFPNTYFGFEPGTTKAQIVECLENWDEGDNGILNYSRAYPTELDTGWYVPPGILHAPGTRCTYEPQRASDVFGMWQSLVADYLVISRDLLTMHVPPDKHYDYDYLIGLLDWEGNTAPDFKDRYFCRPIRAGELTEMVRAGYVDEWIVYGSEWFSAKRLLVLPGRTVTISDPAAYGMICVQGYGRFGVYPVAAPTMIRFGEMTEDEFFVTVEAARAGVTITNQSTQEPLVLLRHFNPGHPDMPRKS